MNWKKAQSYGKGFVLELEGYMDGNYSEIMKEILLDGHKMMVKMGGWSGFTEFNKLSVNEMEEVLGVNEEKIITVSPMDKLLAAYTAALSKDDHVKNLKHEDYTELINLANLIGDTNWRNKLLEMEMAT